MQLKNSAAGPGSCTQVRNHSQQTSETQGKWKGGKQNPTFQNCKLFSPSRFLHQSRYKGLG